MNTPNTRLTKSAQAQVLQNADNAIAEPHESFCGTCGWVWERDGQPVSDEENNAALDARILQKLRALPPPLLDELPEPVQRAIRALIEAKRASERESK